MSNQDKAFFGHPMGLSSLFATEMWERFSYYGMRALLTLFLTAQYINGGFGMSEEEAFTIYGIFTGLVYVTPIIGGILADKFLGQRITIYIGGITMAIGQFTLAYAAMLHPDLMETRQTLFYAGLAILILGNGFFKPNISTMVGELYDNSDPRKDGGFTIFYMGINLGAFLAPMIAGNLGELVAWKYGFLTAGFGMLIGTVWFYLRAHTLDTIGMPPKVKAVRNRLVAKDWSTILIFCIVLIGLAYIFIFGWGLIPSVIQNTIMWIVGGVGLLYLLFSIVKNTKSKTEWSRVGVIIVLALFNIFFWSGFEQAGSTFNIFARDNTNRIFTYTGTWNLIIVLSVILLAWGINSKIKKKNSIPQLIIGVLIPIVYFMITRFVDGETYEIGASAFQSINALAIFIFAPLFTILWSWLDKRKANPNTPLKFGIGMAFLSFGFVIMALGNERAQATDLVSPLWLVMVYVIHTLGELCLSPIGLSMVTKLSPSKIVSTMMGVWMGSFAFGNFVASQMKSIATSLDYPIFWFIAGETAVATFLLIAISPILNKMMKGIK